MKNRQTRSEVELRGFLKGVALSGVAAATAPITVVAQTDTKGNGSARQAIPDRPRPAGPVAPSEESTPREESIVLSRYRCNG
jgi:hypothetical protein